MKDAEFEKAMDDELDRLEADVTRLMLEDDPDRFSVGARWAREFTRKEMQEQLATCNALREQEFKLYQDKLDSPELRGLVEAVEYYQQWKSENFALFIERIGYDHGRRALAALAAFNRRFGGEGE